MATETEAKKLKIQVVADDVSFRKITDMVRQATSEVRKLVEDVARLRERTGKLDTHFRQAQDDVAQMTTSADKILKRGERIDAMDFSDRAPSSVLTGPSFPRAAE